MEWLGIGAFGFCCAAVGYACSDFLRGRYPVFDPPTEGTSRLLHVQVHKLEARQEELQAHYAFAEDKYKQAVKNKKRSSEHHHDMVKLRARMIENEYTMTLLGIM